MMKKLHLSLLMLLIGVWAMALDTSVKNADGVEIWYTIINSTKEARVTYKGSSHGSYSNEYTGEVVIPSTVTYNGVEYSVTSIVSSAFYNCSGLTSVTIPEGVTLIGDRAFSCCSGLTSVTIPESVTSIGDNVFIDCSILTCIEVASGNENYTSVDGVLFNKDMTSLIRYPEGKDANLYNIPESVTLIEPGAFAGCRGLTSVMIPKGVTIIGSDAFNKCSNLTNVTIPEGVTSIGYDAFSGCNKLYEVYNKSDLTITVGSSDNGYVAYYAKNVYTDSEGVGKLKTEGDYIFYVDGDNIELLVYTGDETSIILPSDYEGKEYKIANNAFNNCSGLTSVTIPEGVTEIGDYAFRGCSGLTSVTIPESVTEIGDGAFRGCSGLVSVEFNATNCTSMGSYISSVFSDCNKLTTLTIGDNVTNIPSSAFEGCSGLTSVTIPESVTEIGDRAFRDCSGLVSVEFNATNCTSMGFSTYGVFSDCNKLTTLTIGDNVTKIPSNAFRDCSGLTSVTIPESVTSIGDYAFSGCSSLVDVEFNAKNCTSMGSSGGVFFNCNNLTTLTIGESVTKIPSNVFNDCSSLVDIDVSSDNATYTSVEGVLFSKDKTRLIRCPIGKIASLYNVPESVTSIEGFAFNDCNSIVGITIPESVTSIGERAFYECGGLTSVTIGNGVKSIGDYAFYGCSGLTSVTIPGSVMSIGEEAFYGCSGLTSVTILEGVRSIRERAFYGCSGLTSVIIPESVMSIEENVFYGTAIYDNESNWENGVLYIDNCLIEAKSDIINGDYTVKDGTRVIANSAFSYCNGLTGVTIPGSVTEIVDEVFYSCKGLISASIGEGVKLIDDSAFRGCSSLTSVTIPESVTEIGFSAFGNCSSLTNVTIPRGVKFVDNYAFGNCSSLTSIDVATNNEKYMSEDGVLFNKEKTKLICYPAGKSATSYKIPEGVIVIFDDAFSSCSSLTSVTIPESVTSIGYGAFSGCSGLTNVTIGDGVTEIGSSVFDGTAIYNNESNWENGVLYIDNCLTEVKRDIINGDYTVKDGTRVIAMYAFEGCSGLTSVTIPESVTGIGRYVFDDCSGLTSIDVASSNKYYMSEDGVLFNKDKTMLIRHPASKSVLSYIIPESVIEIGERAFEDCSSLASITIPESVTTIGSGILDGTALYNNESNWENGLLYIDSCLIDVVVSGDCNVKEGTRVIADYVFSDRGFTSITIPESVKSIGDWAIFYCSSLTSVTIGNGVTTIGHGAFSECYKLASITIPQNVTSIGDGAFSFCRGLTSITSINTIPPTIVEDYYKAFDEVDKSIPLYVPAESVEAYKSAEGWNEFTNILPIQADGNPISDVNVDNISVRPIGNNIVVTGTDNYTVYSISGQSLGKVTSVERGIYIVVAEGKSYKVAIK